MDYQKAADDANLALWTLEREAKRAVQSAKAPHYAAAEAAEITVHNAYLDRLIDARKAAAEAQAALDAHNIEQATSKTYAGLVAGTRLVQWQTTSRWGGKVEPIEVARGTLEVWTRESEYPANIRHGHPKPGDFYIRITNKDGSPSKWFERFGWALSDKESLSDWLPEGTTPKELAK